MDIISLIEKKYDTMSKRHKILSDFVRENFHRAAYMNVEQLSDATGVSEATVVRFSAELGFDKFNGFQKALTDYAMSNLTTVQRIEHAREQYQNTDIVSSVLETDIEKIRTTLAQIDKQVFSDAVDAIINAKNIYIIGLRGSSALARFLEYYLNHLTPNVKLVNGASVGDIFEQMFRIGKDDVIVGISFPRYSSRTVRALRYAKKNGATVVSITNGPASPIWELADFPLAAKTDMEAFVDSLVAPMSLINALIVAIGMKCKEEAQSSFAKLESIWHDNEVYNNGEN